MNSTAASRKFQYGRVGWPLLLIVVAIYVGITDARKGKLRGDFSEFTFRASKVMMAGFDPYNKEFVGQNYKYFPTNALIVWPLTRISVYAAQGIWFSLNLGLLIWTFKSLHAMLRPIRVPWWVTGITIAITFRLIVMNLRLGQWNTSVFCLSIIGLRYLHQGVRTGGSLLLGLAITLKYMPVIFLAYLAIRGRWKDFLGVSAAALFWIILFPAIALGPTRTAELMQRFYEDSTARVDQMVTGKKINSQSLHSAVYRLLSPVAQDNAQGVYYVNVVNLPREHASMVAKVISALIVLAAFVWLYRQNKRVAVQINETGTILLIGICYMAWYMAAPGVRHAQLIGIIPVTFGISAAAALAPDREVRRNLLIALAVLFLLYTSPAEIIKDTKYNSMLEVYGVLPFTLLLETMLAVYAFYKAGIGSHVARTWEIDEERKLLVGTPRY